MKFNLLAVITVILMSGGCSKEVTQEDKKFDEMAQRLKTLEGFMEKDGRATIDWYLLKKYKEVDIFECYSLLTEEKRKVYPLVQVVELQMTMERKIFRELCQLNSFHVKSLNNGDDMPEYEVTVTEVDFVKFVKQCADKYKPSFKTKRTKADTIQWVMGNIENMVDTTTVFPFHESKLHYQLVKRLGRYYVNPKEGGL